MNNSVAGVDSSYGEVLFWRYHDKKDVLDVVIDEAGSGKRLPGGKLQDDGMRPVKYHCGECLLIFGYDRPVDCPSCGAIDSMKPGKPGILVKKLQPVKS